MTIEAPFPSIARGRHVVERLALAVVFAVVVAVAIPAGATGPPALHLRPSRPSDRDLLRARARLALAPVARARLESQQPAGDRGETSGPLAGRVGLAAAAARLAAGPDTVSLAALRVEFAPDDDPDTTGDGTFDLSSPSAPPTIDPPPHDAAYFERQLEALRTYFARVSRGRLVIETTLYPPAGEPPFGPIRRMAYYNPDTTQAALDIRLAEFFRDAVQAGDAGVDFRDHDAVMIFHAGVGQDLLIDDPTPSDLPSAFISLGELQEALAPDDPDYPGIEVEGGAYHVRDGFWLPETEVQEGFEFSMHGVIVTLMASQLGLPSLFNTRSGAPGIGKFGLMDQGAGNEEGKLPAAPCAWSRFFLGWEDPLVVRSGADLELAAALGDAGGDNRLLLVPIDSREYYLIENRERELDDVAGYTLRWAPDPDADRGTVVGVVADEYDYGIPGSGLLIWHIDEDVIRAGLDDNTVNADFEHRGVDLEEADGVEDIGLRPDGGFGKAEDAFFAPHATAFGPETLPATISNRGQHTNVRIDDISAPGLVMTCDVATGLAQPGWPDSTAAVPPAISLAAADLDGDGAAEVLVAYGDSLHVRAGDGGDRFPPVALGGAVRGMPLAVDLVAAEPGLEIVVASAAGVRVLTSGGGDGGPELQAWRRDIAPAPGTDVVALALATSSDPPLYALAMAGDDGQVHLWRGSESHARALTDLRSNLAQGIFPGGGDDAALEYIDGRELVSMSATSAPGTESFAFRQLPASVGQGALWLVPAPFPLRTDTTHWLIERAGVVHALDGEGRELDGWPRTTGDRHDGPPAIGDLRGDGVIDLILPGTGRVWALSATGALLAGWPAALDTAAAGRPVTASPVLTDIDGDLRLDVMIASPAGGLFAVGRDGEPLAGWPVAAGRGSSGSPALADLDGDGDVEAVTPDDAGWLYAFDVPGKVRSGAAGAEPLPLWSERGGRERSFRFTGTVREPASAGRLLPESSIVTYPNPTAGPLAVRYELGGFGEVDLEVKILDVTGRELRVLAAHGIGGTLNEIRWDGRDADGDPAPSGVYLLHITARSAGRSEQHFETVAVAR